MKENDFKGKIKLIALDLDGTTLNKEGKFTERTRNAFSAAMDRGVNIVISTGRTFSALPKEMFTIRGLEYVITSNGAHITELASMNTIYENHISPDAIEEIVNILRPAGFSVEAFVDGIAYIDRREYDEVTSSGSTYRDVNYIVRTRNPVDNIFDLMIDNRKCIENININFEFLNDKKRMGEVLRRIPDVTLTSSFIHNWEIGGATTSKAEALSYLMSILDIEAGEMMSCGDSPNDIAMIKLAGLGVAVGNATDEVKASADVVCESNEDDGVARMIESVIQ